MYECCTLFLLGETPCIPNLAYYHHYHPLYHMLIAKVPADSQAGKTLETNHANKKKPQLASLTSYHNIPHLRQGMADEGAKKRVVANLAVL